jgi:hypothetical protein
VVVSWRVAASVVLTAGLLVPAMTAAQDRGGEPVSHHVPPRIELGAGGGLMVVYPEVSALLSVPAGQQMSLELVVGWLPRVLFDVEHAVVQAQVRLPFRSRLRSRRSLLIGVTRIATRTRGRYDGGFWGDDDTAVFPHAGVSLQWPIARHADFRFDAQGLFTRERELPMVPRAMATVVWHPGSTR